MVVLLAVSDVKPTIGSGLGSMDDEEDEIVAEVDVVLSQELAEQLYVMQYPLRPLWRGYDNSMLESVRFKSGQQILEMEYRVKEDEQKREQQTTISSATTGIEYEDPTKHMTTYTVRSSVVPNKSNYLVGLYRESELYVAPLKGVLQMRPSFAYIDQSAEAKRKRKEAEGDGLPADRSAANIRASMDDMAAQTKKEKDVGAGEDAGFGALKPVQFQVKKRETERMTQNRLRSWAHLKQLEAEETFLKLDYVHRERVDALQTFEKLAGRVRTAIPVSKMSKTEFMTAINPPLSEDGSLLTAEQIAADQKDPRTNYAKAELADLKLRKPVPNVVPTVMSHHTVLQLPPSEQIAALFANTSVLTWHQLNEYSNIKDSAELLKLATDHAVIVQGVFVVKTEKSYRHRIANIRNWVLSRLALAAGPEDEENWYISKLLVAQVCGISTEAAALVLDPITTLVPGRGLQLKYAPDEQFLNSHPDICNKYLTFWTKHASNVEADMKRWIKESNTTPSNTNANNSKEDTKSAKATQRNLLIPGASQVSVAQTLMSNATGYAPLRSVTAINTPSATTSTETTTSAPSEHSTFSSSFDINAMALGGNIDLTDEQEAQVKNLILFALETYGAISPKGLVKLAKENTKIVSKIQDFTEALAHQELPRYASKIREVFISPSTDKDLFRDIVIDLFREAPAIKRQDAIAEFKKKTGKDPTRPVIVKVSTELVLVTDGLWALKPGTALAEERRI